MNKDAYYFPHFSNARSDRKIKRLRKELGLEGYGIYFMLLETLREQPEYCFPMEDIDLLADEFNTSEQKVRTVISNYQLFEIEEDEKFFSPKMIMYLEPYLKGKERRKIGGIKGNLIKHGHISKEDAKNLTDAEIMEINDSLKPVNSLFSLTDRSTSQSKVNKSKVKEIKENNKVLIDHFEKVWKMYPRKMGKGSIVKSLPRLKFIFSMTVKEWETIIDRYKKSKPDYQDYQHGSTFFNSGYIDFLDENVCEDVSIDTKIKESRTPEERRYYQLLDMSKKDPDGVTSEELEQKRLAMEESLK